MAAVVVAATRVLTLPRGFWEASEIRFARALLTFDPLRQQPDAPAYPLYVAFGRVVNVFIRDPFVALVTLSIIASVIASLLIGRLGASLLGSAWSGAALAVVVLLSPGMLVFGPLPNAESVAMALVAATFLAMTEKRPELFAMFAAAAIAARPQLAPAMLVVFVIGCATLSRRLRMVVIFAATIIVGFVSLVEAVGIGRLFDVQFAWRPELLLRFVAHPWGGKFVSLPILAVAAVGAFARQTRASVALLAFATVHIVVSLFTADATDGVRPVLPSIVAVSFLAVAALARWPYAAAAGAALFAAASLVYTWPILDARRRSDSPAVRAAHFARGVVVADPDLAPFSSIAVTPERYDEIARKRPGTLHLLVHGRSPGQVFEWPDSDAYGKLTTEKFRVVSVVPQSPRQQYVARSGVHLLESSPERAEWRWLSRHAVIELHDVGAKSVSLRLRLPEDAPIDSNRIAIGATVVDVQRGTTVEVVVLAAPQLSIRSTRSFTPGDARELAVQLLAVEQR